MWIGGCSLAALSAVLLSHTGGSWVLGVAAVTAAQGAVMAGRAARLPVWAVWPIVIGCIGIGALGFEGMEIVLYLLLVGPLLLLVDRFAALSVGLSSFCLPADGAGNRRPGAVTLDSPVARELAHARRDRHELSVVSLWVPRRRGASRSLARLARALVPSLRRSDVIIRLVTDRLAVVLPRADARVADAIIARALTGVEAAVFVGIATFPKDGLTWAALKEVARERERPWPEASGADSGIGSEPGPTALTRSGDSPDSAGHSEPEAEEVEQPEVLLEVRTPGRHLRRAADLLVLALLAPVVLTVIAVAALAVKLDSRGPAFVRIGRVGQDGKPFALFKLRSMTADAEIRKEELRHLNTLPWPDFKISNDPRVTRVGSWLRRYSVDELPQLLNVLRGEMTLVGPRPCSVRLIDYEPWQGERLEVTPGLAGRWQAHARGVADFTTRCRLDISQSQAGSVRMNLTLVLATVRSALRSRGAL
jgi:lipopolysaccharide/colanic/teichoic acid biosynthesis glycosyltransferase